MATAKIYIDSCCLIEIIKGDLGKADPARDGDLDMMRRIMTAAREDKLTALTSLMTVAEVIKAGDAPIDDEIKRKIERMLLSGRDGLTTIGLSPAIVLRARDLAWNDGLSAVKGADRIHLAAAIIGGAREFISWDNRLGKKVGKSDLKGIKLIAPSATTLLPSEFRANNLPFEKKE